MNKRDGDIGSALDRLAGMAPKTDKEDVYDMVGGLLYGLYCEGVDKKRKSWWFREIERIYERNGTLKFLRESEERRRKV